MAKSNVMRSKKYMLLLVFSNSFWDRGWAPNACNPELMMLRLVCAAVCGMVSKNSACVVSLVSSSFLSRTTLPKRVY